MFCELHSHTDEGSNIRLIDSTIKVTKSIDHAVKIGLKELAITDHESLSVHIKAIQYFQKIKESNPDFKLILGNEIYLINEDDYKNTDKFFHFILLAKDKTGHRQLRELSTRAWQRVYTHKRVERVPTFYSDLQEVIGGDTGHILGMTACLGGYFPLLILNNKDQQASDFVSWCEALFGKENFFIELQPGVVEEQTTFNRKAIAFCKEHNLNWVLTNDVHYLTKDKRKLHAAYLNSKNEDRETGDFYENTYFKTEEEMLERTQYLAKEDVLQAFANTIKIADSVESYDLAQNTIVPLRKLPPFQLSHLFRSYYDKYKYIKMFATSEYGQDKFLLSEVEKGFAAKNEEFSDINLARIDVELEQLWKTSINLNKRIGSYYNMVQRLIEIMWDDSKGNSLVGPARGSVTGFYICFLMNITQVNPITWKLPYWRHLSHERPELPDVDIDSQSSQRPAIFQAMKDEFGWEHCLNIITFKRETSKAAIQTACRGLEIDTDTAREVSNLVPISRDKVWSIRECLEGNEDNGFVPVYEFVKKIKKHEMLLETVLEIENLVCGRSSHASGFYLFNKHFIEQNSLMKTPKGTEVTCWDMADSDYCGALKYDFLTVEALDKIRKTMDLLIADGKMKWQGNLKATYDKYLHPNVLNYTDSEMWNLLGNGEIVDVFQFDTLTGGEAVKKIKPMDLKQLALANSVMRLMGDGETTPTDKFVAFKGDISLWYQEMKKAGLNQEEVHILEKYLLHNFGCSVEQEDVMELSMDEHIANFDVVLANKLRKGISKKKKDIIDATHDLFFSKGSENGTRQEMLEYVWNYCIKPQLGYAFSRNHTLPYSIIGLQEMNLVYFYPRIYWNTACLTVNASANEDVEDNKSTDYGKIAKAIGDMQTYGVKIALPDINTANFGFTPDEKNNQIIFGLRGINAVGDDAVNNIVKNRPYITLGDFVQKNPLPAKAMINLIKSGAFEILLGADRIAIMREYVILLTKEKIEPKKDLNMQNFNSVIDLEIIPKQFDFQRRLFNFKKYVFQKSNLIEMFDTNGESLKNRYALDATAQMFFDEECVSQLKEDIDYWHINDDIVVYKNKFDKWYESKITELRTWLSQVETLKEYNTALYNQFANETWEKYCKGGISKWEMDSLSFYYTEHELTHVNNAKYDITDYGDIPTDPIVIGKIQKKNRITKEIMDEWDKYKLFKIVGTVLDKNSNKHYITLLTTNGVAIVKFYDGAFVHYSKQISEKLEDQDKKTVIEKSWFSRGNKLLVSGIRRGNMFYPKRYADSIFQHTLCLIEDVFENGDLQLKYERERVD